MQDAEEKYKILIVDDDKYIRDFLSVLLTGSGYICYTAIDGKEALERVEEIKPDIIFLDLFLVGIQGLEVCKRLKSKSTTSFIPIIIITASVDYQLKIKCLNAGASDFITKPLNPIEINTKVHNFLNIKKYHEIQVQHLMLNQTFSLIETAKKEWEKIVDCINDIIILIDDKDVILRTNKRLVDISNVKFVDLLGRKWQEVFRESGLVYEILDTGDIEFYHPSGRYFNFNIYYINDFRNTKQFAATIILQDITSIKRLTRQLEENQRVLEKKQEELESAYDRLKSAQSQILQQEKMASIGQLAAGVAHEINNPTGYIMSNLNTLLKYSERIKDFVSSQTEILDAIFNGTKINKDILTKLKEKRKTLKFDYIMEDILSLVSESIDGAHRIKQIVQDLKSFSRVDEAEYKLADINAGIESTINIIWNELKYKASVIKELGDIPRTKCNLGQLNQVFMNIFINAVQAIKEKGVIKVKTWSEDSKIYISISDTGVGIPKDKISKIFDPFFTTKPVGEGTGLGLSIVYDIVHKHGGEIKVESELGIGTTFTVSIPVVNKEGKQ